uniref:Uncharacterized protein n=1 Tax=Anguilla anguilla TaxID=7936 RepID=A0A0E9UVC2_ANGAN
MSTVSPSVQLTCPLSQWCCIKAPMLAVLRWVSPFFSKLFIFLQIVDPKVWVFVMFSSCRNL